jgi:hypothetical protein
VFIVSNYLMNAYVAKMTYTCVARQPPSHISSHFTSQFTPACSCAGVARQPIAPAWWLQVRRMPLRSVNV